jgi:hypothetical protein
MPMPERSDQIAESGAIVEQRTLREILPTARMRRFRPSAIRSPR